MVEPGFEPLEVTARERSERSERAPRNVFLRVQIPASPLTSFRSLRSLQSFADSPTLANAFGVRSVPASPLNFPDATRRAARSNSDAPRAIRVGK